MKKIYKIEVDCANCANQVEQAIGKIAGVKQASISFMTQKMKLDIDDEADFEQVLTQIKKTAKKIEPDFQVFE